MDDVHSSAICVASERKYFIFLDRATDIEINTPSSFAQSLVLNMYLQIIIKNTSGGLVSNAGTCYSKYNRVFVLVRISLSLFIQL